MGVITSHGRITRTKVELIRTKMSWRVVSYTRVWPNFRPGPCYSRDKWPAAQYPTRKAACRRAAISSMLDNTSNVYVVFARWQKVPDYLDILDIIEDPDHRAACRPLD